MGTSTNAYLAFGIDMGEEPLWATAMLDDDGEADYTDDDSVSDWLRIRTGKTLEEWGLSIVSHCHIDYPMYILASDKCEVWAASRGCPEDVVDLSSQPTDAGSHAIKELLDAISVAHDKKPGWLLFSMWS